MSHRRNDAAFCKEPLDIAKDQSFQLLIEFDSLFMIIIRTRYSKDDQTASSMRLEQNSSKSISLSLFVSHSLRSWSIKL